MNCSGENAGVSTLSTTERGLLGEKGIKRSKFQKYTFLYKDSYMFQQKNYLLVTAVIFLIIAVLHLLRIVLGWHAEIGGWTVPMWLSWIAVLVAGFLSYSGFKFSK